MEVAGRRLPRYRVWHPLDHVYAVYVRRCADGSIGPGAQIANLEYLGRNPRYMVQMLATVERLDKQEFVHNISVGGLHAARMEPTFDEVAGGTRFGHFLYVPGTPMRSLANAALSAFLPRTKGEPWLKHAIEEMSNLQNFRPQLYEREQGPGR
jgi:hypothetical protein